MVRRATQIHALPTPGGLRHENNSYVGGTVVSTEAAPAALGPYSQAVKAGSTLYISGQIGFDPSTMEFAGDTVEAQTTMVRL